MFSLWGYWVVHIVPPLRLQTPIASWVLSLDPPLGSLCSVHWLAVSIHFCICQALAEPLRGQLYQTPVSKHLLASTIVSGFSNCMWDGLQVWQSLNGLSLSLCYTICLRISPHGHFDPPKRITVSTLWCSFLLSFTLSVNWIVGIPRFWANIHWSGSAYHVCSLVIVLPLSGRHFLVPSIC